MANYCCCYSLEVAMVLIGFLHLNAALFFWARFTSLDPYYMYVDIGVATCYTVRVVFFALMLADKGSKASRVAFNDWNIWTAIGLAVCGVTICLMKYIEYGVAPVWSIGAWTLVGLFNWYHWSYIDDYAKLPAAEKSVSKIEMQEKDADEDEDSDDSAFDEDEKNDKAESKSEKLDT